MGKAQRAKGYRFERAVVNDLKDIYGEQVRRGWQSRFGSDAPDVEGTPYWIECKHHKRVSIKQALKQATEDSEKSKEPRTPLAICKDDGKDAIAVMYWSDLVELLRKVEFKDES